MAETEKKQRQARTRQWALIIYVSICGLLILLTMGLGLVEALQ